MDSEARSIVDDDPRGADGRRRQIPAAVRLRIVTQGCDRCTLPDSGPELRPLYADG